MKTQRKLMVGSMIYAIVFCAVSLTGLFYYALHKEIRIENAATKVAKQVEDGNGIVSGELRLIQIEDRTNRITIPIPAETKSDNVTVENHYMNKELWLRIDTLDVAYWKNTPVFVDRMVTEGEYQNNQDGLWLRFTLQQLCEYRVILDRDKLTIELCSPKELFDRIIIVDSESDEYSLMIAQALKERMDTQQIKVYYTGLDAQKVTLEQRRDLLAYAQADFYIGIRMNRSDDPRLYGTIVYYGGDYFTPELDCVRLADCLERNVVTQIRGRANGIEEAVADPILSQISIPGVVLCPGYVSHETERGFLQQSDYQNRIAEGIYQTILCTYEEIDLK